MCLDLPKSLSGFQRQEAESAQRVAVARVEGSAVSSTSISNVQGKLEERVEEARVRTVEVGATSLAEVKIELYRQRGLADCATLAPGHENTRPATLEAEVTSVKKSLIYVKSTVFTADAEVVNTTKVARVTKERLAFVRSEEGKKDEKSRDSLSSLTKGSTMHSVP